MRSHQIIDQAYGKASTLLVFCHTSMLIINRVIPALVLVRYVLVVHPSGELGGAREGMNMDGEEDAEKHRNSPDIESGG